MRILFLISLLVLCTSNRVQPTTDFRREFGNDYEWAVRWLKSHDKLFADCATRFQLSPKELKAIVFPELIRYNSVFNAIEVESLKYLYVTEGRTYANFSVGFLQMKPSFAEMVEKDGSRLGLKNYVPHPDKNLVEDRRKRLQRLCNTEHQLTYLAIFYKICELKYADRKFTSATEKIKYFATCYNAGYHRSEEQLQKFLTQKNFYGFNYADVSEYYFMNEPR